MDIFDKYKLRIINNKRYYEFGFSAKIYSYELTFYGICEDCKDKE